MKDIERAIKAQQKLITIWEQRIQKLEEVIKKYPWGRNALKYDFGDWRESELLKRKEQIELALITLSALEKQIPKKIDYSELNYSNLPVSKCPACKNTTVNRLLQCNYCPDCGQRLDWEVENE
jgi:hypothetical protein